MSPTRIAVFVAAAGIFALTGITNALAAGVVVVTPSNQQGWTTADTRPGGTVSFVSDPFSPYPSGALQLTTDASITAKAQYLHPANTPLANVTQASYYTKQVSAPFPGADPSYQLAICANGATATACNGFTTLVFEPYQGGLGPVVPHFWQYWNVARGLFWSTRTVTCSNGVLVGTPGGPASYTLDQIKATCPHALVFQFGVNIGSNNPLYTVRTDGFNFNGTIYDFQLNDEGDGNNNGEGGDEGGDHGGDHGGDGSHRGGGGDNQN